MDAQHADDAYAQATWHELTLSPKERAEVNRLRCIAGAERGSDEETDDSTDAERKDGNQAAAPDDRTARDQVGEQLKRPADDTKECADELQNESQHGNDDNPRHADNNQRGDIAQIQDL